jgi:hypothetical protein
MIGPIPSRANPGAPIACFTLAVNHHVKDKNEITSRRSLLLRVWHFPDVVAAGLNAQ